MNQKCTHKTTDKILLHFVSNGGLDGKDNFTPINKQNMQGEESYKKTIVQQFVIEERNKRISFHFVIEERTLQIRQIEKERSGISKHNITMNVKMLRPDSREDIPM